jgi:peptidoglycan/xylan/chitin deacetylase (PgdA/CDA1 family)
VKSQFGEYAGKVRLISQEQVCRDIKAVDERFKKMTGQNISLMWRAPGGKTSSQLLQMGLQCGFAHIAWSEAGFLGDELPSDKYSNQWLLERALKNIRQGDILMAHLGIWSRKDPWAPAVLEPLIVGLKQKGFCFDLLNPQQQHPKISRIM